MHFEADDVPLAGLEQPQQILMMTEDVYESEHASTTSAREGYAAMPSSTSSLLCGPGIPAGAASTLPLLFLSETASNQ